MRERVGDELDYELEAQNQRRIERLMRGHPFVRVPRIRTDPRPVGCWCRSTWKGNASRLCVELTRRSATATGRSSSGCISVCCIATGSPWETRILATTCCATTAGSASWISVSCATSTVARVAAEQAIALAVREQDAAGLKAALLDGGYLPAEPGRRGPRRLCAEPDATWPSSGTPCPANAVSRARMARRGPRPRARRQRAAGRDELQVNRSTCRPKRS